MAKEDGVDYVAYNLKGEKIWEVNYPPGHPVEPPSDVLARAHEFQARDPHGSTILMEPYQPPVRLRRALASK